MIDKILEFSVRQRVLVLMGAFALLLGGLWSATKLPMDAIPDITGVQVQSTPLPVAFPQGQGFAARTSWKRAGYAAVPAER